MLNENWRIEKKMQDENWRIEQKRQNENWRIEHRRIMKMMKKLKQRIQIKD